VAGQPAFRLESVRSDFACQRLGCIRGHGRTQSARRPFAAASVQLSRDGKVIRVHPIRHDRSRELGAFANPKGRPRRNASAIGNVA
jgi:hypothetical protein